MFKKLKSWWNELFTPMPEHPNCGNILIDEILPMFADTFNTTNKTIFIVMSPTPEERIFNCLQVGWCSTGLTTRKALFNPMTQDKIPIRVTRGFSFKTGNPEFEKNGYAPSQIYRLSKLGYMGDISKDIKVAFVTDNFVFFREIGDNSICAYSFDELYRMRWAMTKL